MSVRRGLYGTSEQSGILSSTSGSGTGTPTFDMSWSNNSHIALGLEGNDHKIVTHWSKNANIALNFNQISDLMAASLFEIGASTSVLGAGCEQIRIGILQIDTGAFAGITFDSSHVLTIDSLSVFSINATGLVYGVGFGQNDGSNPMRGVKMPDAKHTAAAATRYGLEIS